MNGIVYCTTKKSCNEVCEVLSRNNITSLLYHANVSNKSLVLQKWLSNTVQIIVATTALSLGVHKADVNFILHYQ